MLRLCCGAVAKFTMGYYNPITCCCCWWWCCCLRDCAEKASCGEIMNRRMVGVGAGALFAGAFILLLREYISMSVDIRNTFEGRLNLV